MHSLEAPPLHDFQSLERLVEHLQPTHHLGQKISRERGTTSGHQTHTAHDTDEK